MKLKTTVEALLNAFALTSPTLDSKNIASNLYLNANNTSNFLYLYSTNLICETATKIRAEVETSGEVLINPGKLEKGLAGLPKDTVVVLSISEGESALKVNAGTVKFSLAANTGVQDLSVKMKAIPSKSPAALVIPAKELSEFARRALFCIPNDQTGRRASLAALKLSATETGQEVYATDGSIAMHASSCRKSDKGSGLDGSLLIPAPALQALNALATKKSGENVSVIVTESKNKVFFKFADGTHFGALTMAVAFPNIKKVVDQETTYLFDVPREVFKQSLHRASFFVSSVASKNILELEFRAETLHLGAKGEDVLSDSVPITYKGKAPESPVKLGMNINHLVNIAGGSRSENLTLGFTGGEKPLIVVDQDGDDDERIDVKYVIMGAKL